MESPKPLQRFTTGREKAQWTFDPVSDFDWDAWNSEGQAVKIGIEIGPKIIEECGGAVARDINGLSDPHWHVNCFIHNATFDPVEKRWKAGQFRELIADKGYFQEYFHTLLAQRLMESIRQRDLIVVAVLPA